MLLSDSHSSTRRPPSAAHRAGLEAVRNINIEVGGGRGASFQFAALTQLTTPNSHTSPLICLLNSRPFAFNSQLSSPNSQLSSPNSQLSTRSSQLSTLISHLSTPNSRLSTLNSQLSILNSLLSPLSSRAPRDRSWTIWDRPWLGPDRAGGYFGGPGSGPLVGLNRKTTGQSVP